MFQNSLHLYEKHCVHLINCVIYEFTIDLMHELIYPFSTGLDLKIYNESKIFKSISLDEISDSSSEPTHL